jgi:orotate phosphoribosyltransferase
MPTMLEELRDVLTRQSVRRGSFTLASGAKSNYFFDCKATTLSPRGALLVGRVLAPLLKARRIEAAGGLVMGATYMTTAIAVASEELGYPIHGFSVREKQKDHGMGQSIDESFHPDGPLLKPGRRVCVMDDVVTKGGSILKAIEAVRQRQCEIGLVVALVDRRAGGGDALRAQGLPYFALFDADTDGNLHVNDLKAVPALAGPG